MPTHSTFLRNAVMSGSLASLLSAGAMARRGRADSPSVAAPFNAVSHWLHGERAYGVDAATLQHTVPGVGLHMLSGMFWGLLLEAVLHRIVRSDNRGSLPAPSRPAPAPGRQGAPTTGEIAASAAVVTAVAALTDLRLVPARLSPGFEHRLRNDSIVLVYVCFAAGLALGAATLRRD